VLRGWLVRWDRCRGPALPRFEPVLVLAVTFVAGSGWMRAQIGQPSTLTPLSSSASSTASGDVPSTVTGEVRNGVTGAPVARALVRMNDRAVLTDHDGRFRFEQNTSANANVMVSKPGFYAGLEMQDSQNAYLQGAQLGAQVELRLYPEAILTGTVLAPDGEPLPRISVTAERKAFDDTGHRWQTSGQGETDSHGNFRIPVQGGDYRIQTRYTPLDRTTGQAVLPVTITGDSSSGASGSFRIGSGEERHFELRPGVSPTHWVTAYTGSETPAAGGQFVRISARASDGSTLQVNPQRDGTTGETRMQLPQGTFVLTAMRGNGDSSDEAETQVTVPDHDISGVVLRFAPVPLIPVELVVDSDSTSDNTQLPTVQQFGLTLQSDQQDPDSMVRMIPGRDQSFSFLVPPGTYRLQGRDTGTWFLKGVTYGESDLLREDLVVVPGAGTPIRITVSSATASLQGTVNLNGSPSAGWVYLVPTGPSAQAVFSLHSGTSGTYTAAHLPPGSYQAIAFERRHSANYRDAASLAPYSNYVHTVTVNAGDKPTLNLDAVPVKEVTP
jgi:hypothetical protein